MVEYFLHHSRISLIIFYDFISDLLEIEILLVSIPCNISNVSQQRFTDSVTCGSYWFLLRFGLFLWWSCVINSFIILIKCWYFILYVCWCSHFFILFIVNIILLYILIFVILLFVIIITTFYTVFGVIFIWIIVSFIIIIILSFCIIKIPSKILLPFSTPKISWWTPIFSSSSILLSCRSFNYISSVAL